MKNKLELLQMNGETKEIKNRLNDLNIEYNNKLTIIERKGRN
jgi:hypothetical protein